MEEYQVCIVGEERTKNELLQVFHARTVIWKYDPSQSCWIHRDNGKRIILSVYSEEFHAMRDVAIKHGHGFILVYSATSNLSFYRLENYKEAIYTAKGLSEYQDFVPLVLVDNTCQEGDKRIVELAKGVELAASWQCPFFETSYMTHHTNADTILTEIANQISKPKGEFNNYIGTYICSYH